MGQMCGVICFLCVPLVTPHYSTCVVVCDVDVSANGKLSIVDIINYDYANGSKCHCCDFASACARLCINQELNGVAEHDFDKTAFAARTQAPIAPHTSANGIAVGGGDGVAWDAPHHAAMPTNP